MISDFDISLKSAKQAITQCAKTERRERALERSRRLAASRMKDLREMSGVSQRHIEHLLDLHTGRLAELESGEETYPTEVALAVLIIITKKHPGKTVPVSWES